MKRLPPSQIIADYRAAYERAYGVNAAVAVSGLSYERGWFRFYDGGPRYRGSQLIHMTAQLNERAKAKG